MVGGRGTRVRALEGDPEPPSTGIGLRGYLRKSPFGNSPLSFD